MVTAVTPQQHQVCSQSLARKELVLGILPLRKDMSTETLRSIVAANKEHVLWCAIKVEHVCGAKAVLPCVDLHTRHPDMHNHVIMAVSGHIMVIRKLKHLQSVCPSATICVTLQASAKPKIRTAGTLWGR